MNQRKTFSLLTSEPALSQSAPASHLSEAHPDVRTFISQFATVVCNDGPNWGREADRDQKARDALAQRLNRHSDPVMVSEKMSSALADLEIARTKAVRREQINPAIYRELVARRVQIAVLSYLAPDEPEAVYLDTSAIEEALHRVKLATSAPSRHSA